ncbi:FadR/GntR family transcriptional regulator [Frigidibacter sp. MR17.14]|uniref:FadR/GntR family transcriptional regulator n=1 Tax=Frigidibacter sp. MR17.14 TaxID=3126509 RepID=UPI003012C700
MRPSLADRIYHQLYGRIVNGDYQAQQKLPAETVLAEELGVSRPILRSALERLREEGLVYSRQGAGSYVRQPQKQTSLGFAKVETIADIQRCYEFRMTLEVDAARLAAERHNDEALAEVEQALALMSAATGSRQHREDADFAFHIAVARAANNHYYEAAMRALREHIHVGMKLHGQSLMSDGTWALERVLAEHTGVFEAIRDRQPDEASSRMRAHIESSRTRLFGGGFVDLRM